MPRLTVVTPLYNRQEYLERIYASLCLQTDKDFQWLVIDDGSNESSHDVFRRFAEAADFEIEYHYKENGGKHTALNYSHEYIKGEYVIILDSDDYLTADAVETILREWDKVKADENIAIVSLLKAYPDGRAIAKYPKECVSDHITFRINGGINGDCCETVRSDVFKSFSFPVFEGEKFLDEMHLWYGIGAKYKSCYVNRSVYVAEYLHDGLSSNVKKLYLENPKGSMHSQIVALCCNINLKNRIKRAILLNMYGKAAGKKLTDILRASPRKLLTLFAYIPSLVLYSKRKSK